MAKPNTTPPVGGVSQMAFRQGLIGFTEIYAIGTSTDLPSMVDRTKQLVKERLKLMGYGIRFTAARTALLPRKGRSQWVDVFGIGAAHADHLVDPDTALGPGNPVWDKSDIGQTSILVAYYSQDTNQHKLTWHSGIPDNAIRTDPDNRIAVNNGSWYEAWLIWVNFLATNGWGWIGRADTPRIQVLRWRPAPDETIPSLQFDVATTEASLVVGDLALITKVRMARKGDPSPNGGPYQISARVTAGDTTTYTIACVPPISLTDLCYQGYVREFRLTVYPIGPPHAPDGTVRAAQILKQSAHKRGIPFGLARGRRPRRGLRAS